MNVHTQFKVVTWSYPAGSLIEDDAIIIFDGDREFIYVPERLRRRAIGITGSLGTCALLDRHGCAGIIYTGEEFRPMTGDIREIIANVAVGQTFRPGMMYDFFAGLRLTPLTPREWLLLQMTAQGKSHKEIGAALRIKERTAQVHRYNLFNKIKVRNAVEAANWYRDFKGAEGGEGVA